MPELPDVVVYLERLAPRIVGEVLERLVIQKPFVLRSVDPPIAAAQGKRVAGVQRIGKRIVMALEDDLFLVIHLMIAGRLRWRDRTPVKKERAIPASLVLVRFEFASGILYLTEAGSKRRASLFLVRGASSLAQFDRGGLDVLQADLPAFAARLRVENHTLKRSLTDPRLFDGIGNAYSDEILHRARLSPLARSAQLTGEAISRLYAATRDVLTEWTARLGAEVGEAFPETVTAFRKEMAVHGKFGEPCPVCGSKVQRIRYAENETNYCARCQTEGRLLADRALSRLLREDWPKSIDEIE